MKNKISYLIIIFLMIFMVGINKVEAMASTLSPVSTKPNSEGICSYEILNGFYTIDFYLYDAEVVYYKRGGEKIYITDKNFYVMEDMTNAGTCKTLYADTENIAENNFILYLDPSFPNNVKDVKIYFLNDCNNKNDIFDVQTIKSNQFPANKYIIKPEKKGYNFVDWKYADSNVHRGNVFNVVHPEDTYVCPIWSEKVFDPNAIYSCGNGMLNNIPGRLPKITSTIVNVIKIAIPIAIIIFGMIDLAKGVVSQKDDEIKKGQKTFFTRLLTGVIVFFAIFIVQIVIRFVAEDSKNVLSCVDCFINNECNE